jgi:hypothetical protein
MVCAIFAVRSYLPLQLPPALLLVCIIVIVFDLHGSTRP